MSGRFQNAEAERFYNLSLESFQDEELGDASTFGWFAYFELEATILQVDSHGFVWLTTHDSHGLAALAWSQLTNDWLVFDSSEYYSEPYDWATEGF